MAALAQISEAKALRLKSESDTESRLKPTGELSPQSTSADLAYQAAISIADLHRRYEAALRVSGAVDFDDLILLPIRLLEEHPDVLAAVQARYRWISVDEYQDVNAAQYRLLRLMTAPVAPPAPQSWGEPASPPGLGGRGANLCVIGDPDQAIYGFRGADRRYFLQFAQDYPGAVTLSLSRNYRSSQRILDAAAQVIAPNPDRNSVEILAEFADEVKLDVYRAPTDKAEAEYVVHRIEQMVGGTSYFSLDSGRTDGAIPAVARSFADFAVLYRLSAQSRLLVEAFDRSGIPYQTVGQTPLFADKTVREVLACLWLLRMPGSRVHLETVLTATVGPSARLPRSAPADGQSSGLPYMTLSDGFEAAATADCFNAKQHQRAAVLAAAWRDFEQARQSGAAVARLVEQAAALMAQQRSKPLGDADAERLRQLALRAVLFENRLADFLEATALQSETDAYDPRADRVTLMSLHAAKGLEFPVVFITGCEEGLLPYERKGEPVDIEEERRLFYVGLTRARNKLVLIRAAKRVLFGQFMQNSESRFVGDIEVVLKEAQEMKYRPPERKPESEQMSLF